MKFPHVKSPYAFAGYECGFNESRAVLIPVPYDGTVSYKIGCREGPHALINASRQLEMYDLEFKKVTIEEVPVHTMDEIEPDTDSPLRTIKRVEEAVEEVLENKKFPIVIGGEHSISLAPVNALKKRYKNLSVLQIDAHPDLREEYEGSKYNHACVMRRIHEQNIQIVQVGIRGVCKDDADYINKNKIPVYYEREYDIKKITSQLSDEVYITVDLDGFDPAYVPGVGTPEPNGLNWDDVLSIIREVSKKKKIVGFDVVELCPLSGDIRSDFFAAKLVYKLLGYSLLK